MMGLFKRSGASPAPDLGALGAAVLALRAPAASTVPPSCIGVVADRGGRTRRAGAGQRLTLGEHETAFCFHPGPYSTDLLPFAAAPELGLRLSFAVDCPDPRVEQQRFDLYLASEAAATVALAQFGHALEEAVQRELAQGALALPPCTTPGEWNAFRAGLNQLLYTRFGITVEDCIPVDLENDYAQILRARTEPRVDTLPAPATGVPAIASDAHSLRRLFLELPCVTSGLRLAVLPPGQALFRRQQALLQRLDAVSLDIGTMPALELAAPGRLLDPARQAARAMHSAQAAAALDETWALLARLSLASGAELAAMFDEADRIVANLEFASAARRIAEPS